MSIWSKGFTLTAMVGLAFTSPAWAQKVSFSEDGYEIRVFNDGSGSVGRSLEGSYFDRWSIDCRVDAMTDNRVCSISRGYKGGIFVFYGQRAKPQLICISHHDFPGRSGQVRIDTGAVRETDKEGCIAGEAILAEMLRGDQWLSRGYEWPHAYPFNTKVSLDGLKKAMEIVDRIKANEF
jgi:hypothetical protein